MATYDLDLSGSRDHSTRNKPFPISAPLRLYLQPFSRSWARLIGDPKPNPVIITLCYIEGCKNL